MQKNIRIIIIGAVLVSASLFGVYWFQQYLLRSRAAAAPPTASFIIEKIAGPGASAGPKVNPGDSFSLVMQINPNLTPFFSFNVAFSYDSDKVSLKNTDPASLLSNIATEGAGLSNVVLLTGVGNTSIDANAHTIRITGLRATGASNPYMGLDPYKMVRISFVMNPGKELPLDFTWVNPDPANSFEKINLSYTGVEPTNTPGPSSPPPVGVPTSTPIPEVVQPTGSYNSLTPVPTIIGGSGQVGQTNAINERTDLLYINSIASYQSPFRYEQALKLEKGTYALLIGAKVYVRRGRGMVVALICNETTCGTKKRNETMYVSPVFPPKTEFSEMSGSIVIPENADNKEFLMRIFCEDGSECDLDYISLEDAWGTERVQNNNFAVTQKTTDPRRQPASWEVDSTANLYGSVDPAFGRHGALMINNSAK